jgi:hypothetical protein
MAIRVAGLPASLPTDQIELWTRRLKQVAARAAVTLSGTLR